MTIIFQINGGIGKVIMATAVVKAIKAHLSDAKIVVISGYPDVFLDNPNVHRSYGFNQMSYFHEEFIEGQDVKVFAHDPYLETSFIKQDTHLLKTWCEMFKVPYNGELPEVFLTKREIDFASVKYSSDKPILLLQTNGGAENQALKYSWARDIPSNVVMEVIEKYKDTHNIVHIRREDQPGYPNTVPVQDNFRSLVTLIARSSKRLLMDSFAQHTAAALKMPSTVLWVANKPEVFGYAMHDNISCNPFTKKPETKGSYLQKFDITGDPVQFPYHSEQEIFDVDTVIASLEKQ